MNWENVLPTVTTAAMVVGLLWSLGRLFRPMAVEVARDATDRLKADLKANDFHMMDVQFDRMNTRFDGVEARVGTVETRLDGVDRRFDAVDARFDTVDARFDAVDARFDAVDARFEGMDKRMDRMDQRIVETRSELNARIGDVQADVRELRVRMEHSHAEILEAIRSS